MGLFDDLPSAKRPAPTPAPASEPAIEPDAKRTKASEATEPPREVDHASALTKIAAHIGNPAKFKKAAQLALALMRGGELERRHGKALFAVLDSDGSGVLTIGELKATMQRLDPSLTNDDMVRVFHMFDANDGEVTLHEFVEAIETMKTFA